MSARISRGHQSVTPGCRVRLRGRGCLATEKDVELCSLEGGEREITIPEGVFIVGSMPLPGEHEATLELEVSPPERARDPVPVEPDRTYTVSLSARRGQVIVTTPQGEELCRVDAGDAQWWATFTTPPGCATVMVDRSAPTLLVETPLQAEDFEPELSALNTKLRRKGFFVGFPHMQPTDDGRREPVLAVEDVALARRGTNPKTAVAKEVLRHGARR